MSASTYANLSYLYEEPGPRTKRLTNIAAAFSLLVLLAFAALILQRFYVTGQLDKSRWFFFARATTWRFLGKGLAGTLLAAAVSGAVAFALGYLFMLCRISRFAPLRAAGTALVEFTRGVPTLLFIYFFFLALPAMGLRLSALAKISLPVAISASGVVAEALRSGVYAVPKGQSEAALSLGMRSHQVFLHIVFPQGFRYVLPALVAEIVIVVKDTTFAYIVSFPDIMQNAKVLISNYDSMLPVYLVVALMYIVLNYALNALSVRLARRRKTV
jgi:glutamate transport system permease protein